VSAQGETRHSTSGQADQQVFVHQQALRSQWIRSGEGFLLLYSITDKTSFDELEEFRTQILHVCPSSLGRVCVRLQDELTLVFFVVFLHSGQGRH
jgi:GTPase SAR1 family protein